MRSRSRSAIIKDDKDLKVPKVSKDFKEFKDSKNSKDPKDIIFKKQNTYKPLLTHESKRTKRYFLK